MNPKKPTNPAFANIKNSDLKKRFVESLTVEQKTLFEEINLRNENALIMLGYFTHLAKVDIAKKDVYNILQCLQASIDLIRQGNNKFEKLQFVFERTNPSKP